MIRYVGRVIAVTLLALVCAMAVTLPPVAAFDPFNIDCTDAGYVDSTVCQTPSEDPAGPAGIIMNITHIVAIIAGGLAIILIIYGSIRYITSGGDASKLQTAKNTIIYSLVGVAVIVLAQAIINYVVQKL